MEEKRHSECRRICKTATVIRASVQNGIPVKEQPFC